LRAKTEVSIFLYAKIGACHVLKHGLRKVHNNRRKITEKLLAEKKLYINNRYSTAKSDMYVPY
jgi:hypothetical protein